jgi:uncharacterized protein (DUF3084 family)
MWDQWVRNSKEARMWLSAAETQKAFLETYIRSVLSIESVSHSMMDICRRSRPLLKASTFAMYAWGAFAVLLSVATAVNIIMTVF